MAGVLYATAMPGSELPTAASGESTFNQIRDLAEMRIRIIDEALELAEKNAALRDSIRRKELLMERLLLRQIADLAE